jgi:two-component system, OmpR family, response regulator
MQRRMLQRTTILLVEDDPAIVEIVRLGLSYEGADVLVATDGVGAVQAYRDARPDLVLLDLMLPRIDGMTVLERIRAHGDTPVIVLTARDALEDRVGGLEAGADDYVTKPFQFPELVARMRAVLRRRGAQPADDGVIAVGGLRIDAAAHTATRDGAPLELTARQFAILELLAANARRVLSKEQIFEHVWGSSHMGDANIVEQQISGLRERIGDRDGERLIHTVRGVGYVLRP